MRAGNNNLLHEAVRDLSSINVIDLNAALQEAVHTGNSTATKVLLNAGADPFLLNSHHETLLLQGVSSGNIDVVKVLLESGYEINWKLGNSAETGTAVPLHITIERENEDMADLLVTVGIETEHQDIDGDTPLIAAANAGLERTVARLIAATSKLDAHGYQGCTALHRAVEHNNVVVTQMLLSAGAEPNSVDAAEETPLMICAKYECTESAQLLISHGADIAKTSKNGQAALHMAAVSDSSEIIELLLGNDADIDMTNDDDNTPLILATYARNAGAIVELLKNGADCNMKGIGGRSCLHWLCTHGMEEVLKFVSEYMEVNVNIQDNCGDSPIILAALNKELQCVKILLCNADLDVNIPGKGGATLLHCLCREVCDKQTYELIIEQGANLNTEDEEGNTALILAAENNQFPLVRALLKSGCTVNSQGKEGKSALHWVAQSGYIDLVLKLIEAEAGLDVPDNEGNTALIIAAQNKHQVVVKELISHGADVNKPNKSGRTALHWVAYEGVLPTVKLLLKHGAKTNLTDSSGDTPLTLAACRFHGETIKALVECGADVQVAGKDGKTAMFYVAQKGLSEEARLLLGAGADPDGDKHSSTALMQAAKNGHLSIVEMLVDAKADVNKADHTCRTALHWATVGGHLEIANILLEYGTDASRQDDTHDTALTLAAWHCQPQLLTLLIPVSDLNHREREEGMAALHLAVAKDFKVGVELLLEAGAQVDLPDHKGNTAFILAAMHTSDSDIIQLILKSRQTFDINQTSDKGRTALHWSVGDAASVRAILPHTMMLNELDGNGASPLLLAIAHSQSESARVLIEAGCDINLVHQDGRSAIHHACIYGALEVVEILVGIKGVDPNILTEDGKSPLLLASIEGHSDLVKFLLKHGSDVNRIYYDAITALSAATAGKHYQCMKALLESGAHPDLIGSKKHKPLNNCIMENDMRGAVMLIQANADLELITGKDVRPIKIAIVQKNEVLLSMLCAIECDINYLQNLFKEGIIYYFIHNDEMLEGLKAMSLCPPALQMLCRRKVRKLVLYPFMTKVKTLPVPQMIKDYLLMKDLWKLIEN